jgi:amino acid adenylation domain-containing protein
MLSGSIHQAFRERVALAPDRIAVVGNGPITYSELARRAEQVAARLRRNGIGRGNTVGLFAQRSPEAMAAMLGILQAGAAYVPFDPSYPPNLLRYIHEDSTPSAMLVQDSLVQRLAEAPFWAGQAISLASIAAEEAPADSPGDWPAVQADDPAYIMYTSGSTGRPKGVVVPQRAVLRLVIDNDYVDFGPDQVVLQLAPLAFDASTFEIWGALLNGGTLAIVSDPYPSLEDIGSAIARHHVTTLWLTAGMFHLMIDNHLEGLKPLRQLVAGGDVLSPVHVAKVLRALPDCRLVNGYGPTENTTFSCCYTVPKDFDGATPLPIGRAIRHTETYILDEALRAVPPGEEGELYVGGLGLAIGYHNRPQLTAERFIHAPADSAAPGRRLYRTGDRVRQRPDGNIAFCGRIDRQVKINGKRVELDEIETCLRASGLAQDAAVICTTTATGQRRINAFVTPAADRTVPAEEVRAYLRRELPDYMVPASIISLPALPLSPTGKVDRARLPLAAAAQPPAPTPQAPQSSVEGALADIWCRVLGKSSVGLDDNFFDLGGTSLQLLEVHAIIKRSLQLELTVLDMFQYPRINALSGHLTRRTEPQAALLSAQDRALRARAALGRRRQGPPAGGPR